MTTQQLIGTAYRPLLSTQTYGRKPQIEGVQLIDLQLFSDEGGDFCELTRFASDGSLSVMPGYRPAQISYSFMESGTIKAWHLHEKQDDLWFVPPHDRVLVGLLDTRQDSPTYQTSMRLVLGAGKARLLLIPRGVAHGGANLSSRTVNIVYFANHPFNPEHPDEHRLPFNILGADFWSIQPG